MSIKKECVVVAGNCKCCRCLKGKKGCKFTVANEEEEEESLVAALKKILSSPICSLHKRKEVDLLPGSVKERAETLSVADHATLESEALELELDKDNCSIASPKWLFFFLSFVLPHQEFCCLPPPVGLACVAGGHYSHPGAVCVEGIFILGGNC